MRTDHQDLRAILADFGLRDGAGEYAKGQERLQQIIEEAMMLIETEGLKAFTMRGLARKTDITLAHLQHFFKDRSAVLLAISRVFEQAYKREIERIFDDPARNGREKVDAFLDLHLRHPEQSSLPFSLYSESQTSSPGVAGPMMDAQSFAIEKISVALSADMPGVADKELRSRVATMLATLHGMHFFYGRNAETSPAPEGFREACFEHIQRMLFQQIQN